MSEDAAAADLLARLKTYHLWPRLLAEEILDRAIADVPLTPEETAAGADPRRQRIEKWRAATWTAALPAHFLRRKTALDRVVYSLLRVRDPALAAELHGRLERGERTFAELAAAHSEGPEAHTGGLLGPVPLGSAAPEVAQILAAAVPGQLRPPVRLGEWLVILRLEKTFPARLDDPAVRAGLLQELADAWLSEQVRTAMRPGGNGTTATHTPQPTADTPQPTADTPQPTADTLQPTADTLQPAADTLQPAFNTSQPAANMPQSVADMPQPAADMPQPAFNTSQPAADTHKSDADTHERDANTLQPTADTPEPTPGTFPFVPGTGELDAALACFEMVCHRFELPFRREVLRRTLANGVERASGGPLSLPFCGAVAELAGLDAQLVRLPARALTLVEPPSLLRWDGQLAVLQRADPRRGLELAVPASGPFSLPPPPADENAPPVEVLLLRPGRDAEAARADGVVPAFGLRWFWPAIQRHRRVLGEVLVASFFVQLFALANPLLTQVVIDKVLVQNAPGTLGALGVLMLGVAFFGALLGALRTYLFVDTTNRIDLSLGSAVIRRLFRLPLGYFQRRPVGEVATRLGELENIRQFLTGTALTVVLDAVFSVIYLGVMLAYSVPLTAAALGAVPLLAGLTLLAAPVQRRQLRARAERFASAQSYLVETLGGIATVKAQSLEAHARWQWLERYTRFVSAGFRTSLTGTTVQALSGFLGRLGDLAVLWFGAGLVLENKLTLGQLIAFRILAGYVSAPLLRLAGSWQQFQEVGLSIERLGDILDTPPEQTDRAAAGHIALPPLAGAVEFREVTFAYVKAGGLPQLREVSFAVPAGSFVGVVGQSGSGKSTLLKLLPRLYLPDAGRVLVDGYDVEKVELDSLRRQLGTVLQDSLLFDGTVRENLLAAAPEATDERLVAAARTAAAHEFIMALPEGYQTRVGEGGRALSGGQRQRVAIARTVLQNPRLLILDEATSALDFATEREVCRNLAAEFRGRTVFFVTHRLRSIQAANVILFLDNGVLAERGTHGELLALNGRYAALFAAQQDAPG